MFDEYFTSKGYNFIVVDEPRSILKHIKTHQPDVIIVDNSLKDVTGASLIVALRKRGLKMPIFVIAKFIDKQLLDSLQEYDVSDFFPKPVEFDKLESLISSTIPAKKKPVVSQGDVRASGPPSILVITENEDIINEPSTFVPGDLLQKRKFRVISKSDWQGSIDALKKPANNVRVIVVDATNEDKTLVMTRLLRIVVAKLKIPVYFFTDVFSPQLKESLIKLGFDNFVVRNESGTDNLQNSLDAALVNRPDEKKAQVFQQRRKIIRDISSIKSLPPLPDIFLRVEKLARDPNATVNDYSGVIELDPGITARLLRMSNSAHFSFTRKIKSVGDAVALMGTREILSLVRLACITGTLRTSPEVETAVKKVWEQSAYCAITAQMIYEKTEISKLPGLDDDLFIAGIIHDIGKIVLWKFFPDIYMSFMLNPETGEFPQITEEEQFLGISHSGIGATLAEHWHLPDFFKDVIAFHHSPMSRHDSELVMIIHIADFLSILNKSETPESIENRIDTKMLDKIGYTAEKFRDLGRELAPVIKEKAERAARMITG
ncbi:response regulator [bacterium]|nr:response regulator [bacterium]